jgi:hypothetical protein
MSSAAVRRTAARRTTMLKKIATLTTLAAAAGILIPAIANANTIAGRVTSFSPTSISVLDTEVVTVGIDNQTTFSKLITQKPWQENTALSVNALRVGRYVVVHVPNDNGFVANWVQVATDVRIANGAPLANLGSPAPVAQANSGDTLGGKEVRDLIANAKTPAEHRRLAKHFETVAARYGADAADHVAEAKAYRSAPSASESKRPGSPDTAMHCDRLADAARNAATAARELARDHEKMAK